MQSRQVTNIAAELLDYIFFFVEDPPDLLNVALASKQFHAIVASRHIENRLISCDPNRLELWEHLASSESHSIVLSARMMSCLELTPEDSDVCKPPVRGILPRALQQYDHHFGLRYPEDDGFEEEEEEHEEEEEVDDTKRRRTLGDACAQALSNAIRSMPNLTRIRFRSCDVAATHEIFSALLEGCTELRDVEIECDIEHGFSGTRRTKAEDGLATSPVSAYASAINLESQLS